MQQHAQLHTHTVDQQLVVLNSKLSERLTAVNQAHRALSARGYSIVSQHLRQGSHKRPLLNLERGDEELREDLRQVAHAEGDHGPVVLGRFMDVDVSYPLTTKAAA